MRCPKCGIQTKERYCPECGERTIGKRRKPKQSKAATTAKLIMGIVSIVLFALISFQSCTVASLGIFVSEETATSGFSGLLLSFLMLIAGIVGTITRKNPGGSLTAAAIWILGSIVGFTGAGIFSDLAIWSFLALAFGVAYFIITIVAFYRRKYFKKWWFYGICLLIMFAIAASATGKPGEQEPANEVPEASEQSPSQASIPISVPPEKTPAKQEEQGVFKSENFKAEYISHSIVSDTWDGATGIDIIFEFENYTDEPISYDVAMYCQAFQDGVQLETSSYTNDECEDWGTEVMAGSPIMVNDTFVLRNTESPVQVIMKESFSFEDDKMEITLELK